MMGLIRDLALCTAAGLLLATIFVSPAGVAAGAAQGFFVGTFVAWGKWKAQRTKPSPRRQQDRMFSQL